MDADDDALMARIAEGDERAYGLLVSRHMARVRAIALGFTGNHADADDVAQDVFWRIWRKARDYAPGAARFSTWLYRVTSNACVDHVRRKRLKTWTGLSAIENLIADRTDTERAHAARGELDAARAVLAALPAKQRMALLLSVEGELANAQIAATMELSEGAVEQLLVRARRTLRDRLSRERGV